MKNVFYKSSRFSKNVNNNFTDTSNFIISINGSTSNYLDKNELNLFRTSSKLCSFEYIPEIPHIRWFKLTKIKIFYLKIF